MAYLDKQTGLWLPGTGTGGGGGGGSGGGVYYKCASVDTTNKTWEGYKAVLTDGVYSFEETATTGLTYGTAYTPKKDGIYNADTNVEVKRLLVGGDQPFTLTALTAGSTVKFAVRSGTGEVLADIKYRTLDSADWIPYTMGDVITLANKNDYVQFWNVGSALSYNDITGSSYISCYLSGTVTASGNIMSLVNYGPITPCCFYSLFLEQSGLTGHIELPALELAEYCYQYMFHKTSITSIHIYATKLANYCMKGMLSWNQTYLQTIEVDFTDWGTELTEATREWVIHIPSTGTFVKPTALSEEFHYSHIPTGWTVVNK